MCVLEDSPSGLWRTLGKRVGCKPSGVRIPHPPQISRHPLGGGTFILPNRLCVVACVDWGVILRVTVSSEPPQGRKAARIRVRCRVRGGSFYFPLIFRTGAEREGKHDERTLRTRAIGHLVLFLSRILVGVVGETGVLSWSASTARSDRMCW